ncbi:MAG TPA: M55 family metallopeptidase [Blastocatellia bacterium]
MIKGFPLRARIRFNGRSIAKLGLLPVLILFVCTVLAGAGSQARKAMKIYISVDMEGVAGVVTADQLLPSGFEYERFRVFMTDEVNAAISGARDAGATEFVISDSHGNSQNILIDKLPSDVRLVRGSPRPLSMMEGIDSSFAGVIFIGYHASTNNMSGVRAHTMSSALLTNISIDGRSVSEAGFNAAIAGHFGVPVIMISGDDVIIKEAQAMLGNIKGAVVKRAIGFHSAESMTPQAAQILIRETARDAVSRIGDFKPFKVKEPVQLDISFKNYRPCELLGYLPIVERTDSHSIRFMAKDMVEAQKFLEFVTSYQPDLAP